MEQRNNFYLRRMHAILTRFNDDYLKYKRYDLQDKCYNSGDDSREPLLLSFISDKKVNAENSLARIRAIYTREINLLHCDDTATRDKLLTAYDRYYNCAYSLIQQINNGVPANDFLSVWGCLDEDMLYKSGDITLSNTASLIENSIPLKEIHE